MLKVGIYPSLLAADMGNMEAACRACEKAGADALHVDIMDGHFVPNLSMGPDMTRMARACVSIPLHVHLMVTRPDFFAGPFMDAGADTVLIHIESDCDVVPVLAGIRARGKRCGLVLNPETTLATIIPHMGRIDEVLFMTVHPGFGGQAFIPSVLPKIKECRQLYPDMDISVDGGVTPATAIPCAESGANIMLGGTSILRAADMHATIEGMRQSVETCLRKSGYLA